MSLPMHTPVLLALIIAGALPSNVQAQAAPVANSAPADLPACTLKGKSYICSQPPLLQALAAAHTVALVSQPANHASDAALASLARSLGKTVDPGNPADLTLRLTPIEPTGVSVGTGTVDLATLNIFIATPADPTARLLWSETYNGNPDLPWPTVVNALIRQFKTRLGAK